MAAFADGKGLSSGEIRLDTALDAAFAECGVPASAAYGPFVARMQFVTPAARDQWTTALVPGNGRPADFSIAILDTPLPALEVLRGDNSGQGYLLTDGRYTAHWQPVPDPLLHLYDRHTRRGLVWYPGGNVPPWVWSRPALQIVHAFTESTDWVPVHGAAVGLNGQFLFLAGKGGAGKTTAALTCAERGWTFAGDDYVLLNANTRQVGPLFASARVRATGRETFSNLLESTRVETSATDGEIKDELRLGDHAIGSRIGGGTMVGVLVTKREGAEYPAFGTTRALSAFQAMISSSIEYPFGRQAVTTKILDVLKSVPLMSVDTGRHPPAIPAAFEKLLSEIQQ